MVAPGGFEERTSLLNRPPLPLWLAGIGQPHNRGDIARKQLFGHGVGERGAEHIADVLDGPVGKYLVAACTDGAATAAIGGARQQFPNQRATPRRG